MIDLKIGCDPEVFIKQGFETISAFGLLPGTKNEPYEVDRGAVQVDGMAFEFNITPANTEDDFDKNIKVVLVQMEEMIHKIDKSLKLSVVPFTGFDRKYWQTIPKEAKVLGCDPDYTFEGKQQTPEADLTNQPIRTAAGHVHLGWTEDEHPQDPDHFAECMRISHAFKDEVFFQPKTLLEKKRLMYYGGNGAFRPKRYGVELRAPSNRWISKESSRRTMYSALCKKFYSIKR